MNRTMVLVRLVISNIQKEDLLKPLLLE